MYKLTRLGDGLVKQSKDVMWIQWNSEGRFDSKHDEPAIGRSLIMSPFDPIFFTWQTTPITAFKPTESGVEFVTKNSNYVLERIEETINTDDNGNEQI
jgi:hypothetical protein